MFSPVGWRVQETVNQTILGVEPMNMETMTLNPCAVSDSKLEHTVFPRIIAVPRLIAPL